MGSSRNPRSAERLAKHLDVRVAEELARYACAGATVTVGLSGGIDSIVLLDTVRRAAAQTDVHVRALHVNHGLSPNAAAWERFCTRHCRRRGIEFEAVAVNVEGAGANIEAQARRARYRAFVERGSELIALAHNLDDQAETVLMHLLRGSGVRGLAAMPPIRLLAAPGGRSQRLLRPLLGTTRAEILDYATRRRLRWIEDESNANERFTRNFVRLRVLPLLERRFPGAKTSLARAAGHLQDAAGLLDEIGAADCAAITREGRIEVAALYALGTRRALNALRIFLEGYGELPPSSARMDEIFRQLTDARRDALPQIELRRGTLRRYRGWIEWRPRTSASGAESVRRWRGELEVDLDGSGVVTAVKTRGEGISAAGLRRSEITLRRRSGGERMRVHPNRPTRTLKNLLQEAGVPPWQRDCMPLLFCGEQLVWAPGIGVAVEYQASAGEPAWRFHWRAPGEPRDAE